MLQVDNLQHHSVYYYSSVLLSFNGTNQFHYKVHVIVPINGKMESIFILQSYTNRTIIRFINRNIHV